MKGFKASLKAKNLMGASSCVAPKKRDKDPSEDGPNAKRQKPSPPLSQKAKKARKKSADKKNTAKQKRDHAAKNKPAPRKAHPPGRPNPKGRKRDRVWCGAPRG